MTADLPDAAITAVQYDQLTDLCRAENRKLRRDGHEQVFTMTGLIRAAVFVCLADPRLTARLLKVAADPRLAGGGGIAHLVKTRMRAQK